jgi:hypothetical protein
LRPIEEQDVGRDARVGREHAVRQPHHGVEIEFLEQFFFDSRTDTVAEQCSVRHNHGGSTWFRGAPNFSHYQLKKQQRGFRGSFIAWKVRENAALFFTAEWRIGEDDVDAILLADLGDAHGDRIVRTDLRRFESVQQQIHLREQIRQWFRFAAKNAPLLQQLPILDGFA